MTRAADELHRYIVSEVIDNAATLFKTTKQLVHEFTTGRGNSIIEPVAEPAKRIPRLSIAFDLLVLEAEDDRLETKLGAIWRAGREEQAQRLATQAAFDKKVAILRGERKEDEVEEVTDVDYDSSDDSEGHSWHHRKRHPTIRLTAHKADGVDETVAEDRVRRHFAKSWVRRVTNAKKEQERREVSQVQTLNKRFTQESTDSELPVRLVNSAKATPLVRAVFKGVDFSIGPPSFDLEGGLAEYLHQVGGNPRDTQYSTLIPLHLGWQLSEARVTLRDYPLPLLHIPMASDGATDRAWRLETDFVIAEEIADSTSTRYSPAVILPGEASHSIGISRVIPRTVMPTKMYAQPQVELTSAGPVYVGWGNALQPAIQDMTRVIDTLSKVPPDPSERIGFWDKVRLVFHGQASLHFDGALLL